MELLAAPSSTIRRRLTGPRGPGQPDQLSGSGHVQQDPRDSFDSLVLRVPPPECRRAFVVLRLDCLRIENDHVTGFVHLEYPAMPNGSRWRLVFRDGSGTGDPVLQRSREDRGGVPRPGTFALGGYGHIDADGCLSVAGRMTDTVISGAVNIIPAESERVLGLVSPNDEGMPTDQLIDFC